MAEFHNARYKWLYNVEKVLHEISKYNRLEIENNESYLNNIENEVKLAYTVS